MTIRFIFTLFLTLTGVNAANSQDSLPDGEGRDIVEDVCTTCHDLINITKSRRSHEQWQFVVSMMIAQGAPLEEYEIETVVDYLSKNFGNDSK
jgi:competence protein ComEA